MALSSFAPVVGFSALLLFLLLAVAPARSAITCGSVASQVSPCVSYIRGKGPLTPGCCNAVKMLNAEASNTISRQTVCSCLKSFTKAIPGVNYSLLAGLPNKCGVSVPYPISPSTDCSKYIYNYIYLL